MSIFDEIKLGVEQAIEYEKGNLKAKKRTKVRKNISNASMSEKFRKHSFAKERSEEKKSPFTPSKALNKIIIYHLK